MPKTRYAKTDGVSIAYQVVGEGPRDLVLVPGFVSNVEHYWEIPQLEEILNRLASFSRLLIFDKRGTGLSDPVAGVSQIEERMDDLRAVMDAASSESAALFGISEGGPMSLMFSAAHPRRTSALALYGTTPRFTADPTLESPFDPELQQAILEEIDRSWGEGALLELFAPSQAHDEALRSVWGRYQRAGASPAMARLVMQSMWQIDVRDVLKSIRVPTLIVHRTGDLVSPVDGARYMAEQIPNARLIEFPGDDHLPIVGDYQRIIDEVEEFFTGVRPAPTSDRVLATILFTDIVGSTQRAVELGDRRWRDLLHRHDAVVRRQIERFQGHEVKTTGDGFLATFDGPARAIQSAVAIRDAVRQLGLEIRAGLHTGECERMNGDIGGVAVHIGARVGALAQPGEVLVSSTVKDLVVGVNFSFGERGEHELKGAPGRWRLYAVGQAAG